MTERTKQGVGGLLTGPGLIAAMALSAGACTDFDNRLPCFAEGQGGTFPPEPGMFEVPVMLMPLFPEGAPPVPATILAERNDERTRRTFRLPDTTNGGCIEGGVLHGRGPVTVHFEHEGEPLSFSVPRADVETSLDDPSLVGVRGFTYSTMAAPPAGLVPLWSEILDTDVPEGASEVRLGARVLGQGTLAGDRGSGTMDISVHYRNAGGSRQALPVLAHDIEPASD